MILNCYFMKYAYNKCVLLIMKSLDKENMSANMNSRDRNCQLATAEILQP